MQSVIFQMRIYTRSIWACWRFHHILKLHRHAKLIKTVMIKTNVPQGGTVQPPPFVVISQNLFRNSAASMKFPGSGSTLYIRFSKNPAWYSCSQVLSILSAPLTTSARPSIRAAVTEARVVVEGVSVWADSAWGWAAIGSGVVRVISLAVGFSRLILSKESNPSMTRFSRSLSSERILSLSNLNDALDLWKETYFSFLTNLESRLVHYISICKFQIAIGD